MATPTNRHILQPLDTQRRRHVYLYWYPVHWQEHSMASYNLLVMCRNKAHTNPHCCLSFLCTGSV
uniref:Uncharacterized protein n=1 Tax=Amphimedon queenslandica TaxID=400682 RepID=A0A1X7U862_AMPQE